MKENRKITRAVVLAGGGARGAYQLGVWQGLRELGIGYQIVTGTSVGAINAALMAQGDFDAARDMWSRITYRDIVSVPDVEGLSPEERRGVLRTFMGDTLKGGGLEVSALEHLLREVVDEGRLRASGVNYGLVTTRFPQLRPVELMLEDIPQGELVDYILASAAYFPFFRRRSVEGDTFVDGALSDNLPAHLAVRHGAEEVIAVDLSSIGIVHPYRDQVPVVYIRSYWDLGPVLGFQPDRARVNIQLGYQDTLRAYRKVEGRAYAFYRGESAGNAMRLRDAMRLIRNRTGADVFSRYQWPPRESEVLRYRPSFFLQSGRDRITRGRAIASAGELAGELLNVPPDRIYTFREFNNACLAHWRELVRRHGAGDQAVLRLLHRLLMQSLLEGRPQDRIWALATISPKAMVAAIYLLALELCQGGKETGE